MLAIDLFCGLGGWAEGLIAEGFYVVGFDIERHDYGTGGYPGQLVIQDVFTLHGSQFRNAAVIVASPPCTEYSYMAMPWSRAKQIARALRGEDEFPEAYKGSRTVEQLNALFNACFRIQREACEAAGRHIPLIVENVKGAQPWVGRAKWNFGSFFLWGDVPALMPITLSAYKSSGLNWSDRSKHGQDFTRIAGRQAAEGLKLPGNNSERRWEDRPIQRLRDASNWRIHGPETLLHSENGIKESRNWWSGGEGKLSATTSSKSPQRKAASAQIAKIPFPLSRHIAQVFKGVPQP